MEVDAVRLKHALAASEREATEALRLREAQVDAGRRRESCREAASALQRPAGGAAAGGGAGGGGGYSFLSAAPRGGGAGAAAAWVLRPSGLFECMDEGAAKELMVKGAPAQPRLRGTAAGGGACTAEVGNIRSSSVS